MTTNLDFGPETTAVQAAIDSLAHTKRSQVGAAVDFILDQRATETFGKDTPWTKRHNRNAVKVEDAARGAGRLGKAITNPAEALTGVGGQLTRNYHPVAAAFTPTLQALACRDLITKSVYDQQTIVWRAFIGPLHPEDPDSGFTKTERLMLRRAVEADPMGSLKDALAAVAEVTK